MKNVIQVNLPKLTSFAIAVLLAGCANVPPPALCVEVPVIVPCAGPAPERPAYELDVKTRLVINTFNK